MHQWFHEQFERNKIACPFLPTHHAPSLCFRFSWSGPSSCGFDEMGNERTCYAMKLRRFCSFFGLSPKSCMKIYSALESMDHIGADWINKSDPLFFLITMDWLSTYKTEEELARSYNMVEKTIQKRIWEYALALKALKAEKVSHSQMPASSIRGSSYSH